MRIVYMGTPDFAVPCLEVLIKSKHEVVAVYTQPDKPKGRGYVLTPPPVKVCALENNIKVLQPKSLKSEEEFEVLKNINPDVIVVAAYGKILPENIINLPKYGCINLHGSLLPKYRGAAPIQWAVIDGEVETGITVMQMDKGLDTGDMLFKESIEILENETASQLHDRLSILSSNMIINALECIENGTIKPEKQNDNLSTYAHILDKSLCVIDWSKSNIDVHNKVRGLNSWPIATSTILGKRVKIFLTKKSNKNGEVGQIVSLEPLTVACGENSVEILELQLEGKRKMEAQEFLRGQKINLGDYFI